ncbi:ribbon-helix-helix domain-containing protein [Actinokineospora bangkokensis]|uniref:Uncharacterized protein n=1 Tax=Actinokineospora bangkokensis TaxID=1193682 RepID=A0A1Q9LC12_9PSEU|nr:hypothetical protein [Actinokineospora bangkokensis]OLR89545.1 hypothetical protein BJP25_05570 [Actinokineospora bangkokensis]
MSEQAFSTSGGVKPLAVRLSDDMRAQLDVLAQVGGHSTTEEIRLALVAWIEQRKTDPTVLAKAAALRAEIEAEAQKRERAIAAIFGASQPDAANPSEPGEPPSNDGRDAPVAPPRRSEARRPK